MLFTYADRGGKRTSPFGRAGAGGCRPRRARPQVEPLEDRTVPTKFFPAPGTPDGAAGSLRADIITANGNGVNDGIFLDAGTYALTVLNLNNATANNLQENAAATGDLDVTEANHTLTIEGQGAGVTFIDATGLNDRVLHILSTGSLVLRDLTIRGGLALEQGTSGTQNGAARGGGIFNAGGDLTLLRVVVENNEARGRPGTGSAAEGGGVHSTGPLTITDSTIRNNRAVGADGQQGLFSSGLGSFVDIPGGQGLAGGLLVTSNSTAVVLRSTISGNQAVGGTGGLGGNGVASFQGGVGGPGGDGGEGRGGGVGVRNNSTLTLTNSTVSSNSATGGPGGVGGPGLNGAAQGNGGNGGGGRGGGVAVDQSTLTLFNDTVAANATATSAGGPGTTPGGLGQTLGGGLGVVDDAFATVNSTSSLFADNAAATGPDVQGTFDTASRTLVQNGAAAVGVANNDANGNRVGVAARLAPLGLNGGLTATHALLPGSAAIDGGSNPQVLTTDQRGSGFARVVGAAIDIGAFEGELAPPSPPPPPPPPAAPARGILATIVAVRRKGGVRRLFVRVTFADTGELKAEFRSPFQKPAFRGIVAAVLDTTGDGVADTVVVRARKGKRTVTRTFPG